MDIFTYEIEASLQDEGCPLCRAVALDERRWMQVFVREGHRDPGARRGFLASGGFCAGHAELLWTVARERDAVAVVATLCMRLADQEIARADGDRRASTGPRPDRWLRRSHESAPRCPACAAREASEERKQHFFCVALAAAETRARYAASGGLCSPHFRAVMAGAAREQPDVAALLRDDHLRRLRALRVLLGEFDRKLDHRYRHEPPGAERQAPHEALVRFAGTPPLRDALVERGDQRDGEPRRS